MNRTNLCYTFTEFNLKSVKKPLTNVCEWNEDTEAFLAVLNEYASIFWGFEDGKFIDFVDMTNEEMIAFSFPTQKGWVSIALYTQFDTKFVVNNLIPQDYYRVRICDPDDGIGSLAQLENLGKALELKGF